MYILIGRPVARNLYQGEPHTILSLKYNEYKLVY